MLELQMRLRNVSRPRVGGSIVMSEICNRHACLLFASVLLQSLAVL